MELDMIEMTETEVNILSQSLVCNKATRAKAYATRTTSELLDLYKACRAAASLVAKMQDEIESAYTVRKMEEDAKGQR